MNREPIPLSDIKSLDYLAEEILHYMRFSGFSYDENGELLSLKRDEMRARFDEYANTIHENILEFRECTVFKELSIHEFCILTVEDIQEKYLAEILPKACNMMRKQACVYVNAELSPEITDDYLKDLFTIRWRDNAMMWIARFGKPDPALEEPEETDLT